jgi:FMN phosphatase YigB (HAD superfamily)
MESYVGQPSTRAVRRVFFDVDNTLVTWDGRLRPLAREVMAELRDGGFALYLWSGVGRRWEVAHVHELTDLISGCFEKPLSRHRERLGELGVPFPPDHVVDDDEELVAVFGGTLVPVPQEPLEADRHLLRVLDDVSRRFGAPGR